MFWISNIIIDGFRRLRYVDIPLKTFSVLIGANSVGKSSILDIISLMNSSAVGKLNERIETLGGVDNFLTRGRASYLEIILRIEHQLYLPSTYNLTLLPRAIGYIIEGENLSQEQEDGNDKLEFSNNYGLVNRFDDDAKIWDQKSSLKNPYETALSQLLQGNKFGPEIRNFLSSCSLFHALDISPRSPIKLPQQVRPTTLPSADGGDLVSYLFNLRESNPNRFEAIIDALKAAFPGFESLGFPPVAAGMVTMTWKEKSFDKPLYINELSEGTLRFLWLVSILQSPDLPAITMIDEPEVSLHPEMLQLLVELMREASRRSQIIVATHSDRFVRFLKPEEVLVMDIGEDGGATAKWADEMDLDKWLEDYSLDEVWRMGRMGGRS